jgi:hypothetical protein
LRLGRLGILLAMSNITFLNNADSEPGEFVEKMARLFVELYGSDGPAEIAAVVEMLCGTGRLEAAELWTHVMHASREVLAATPRRVH